MAKFLKKFATTAEYNTYIESGDKVLPNVSYVVEENDTHFEPYVDPYRGHSYIEIGGLKWATMNIGANSVTDYGLYFQWGDTQGYTASEVTSGKKAFNWPNYKYCDGTSNNMTKYNNNDGKKMLEVSDDAAQANWGGNWRMPTIAEFKTLCTVTTSACTSNYENSGIGGLILTSKGDSNKKLFFPFAGFAGTKNTIVDVGYYGEYWSSSLYKNSVNDACLLCFSAANWLGCDEHSSRYVGYPIRPVAS